MDTHIVLKSITVNGQTYEPGQTLDASGLRWRGEMESDRKIARLERTDPMAADRVDPARTANRYDLDPVTGDPITEANKSDNANLTIQPDADPNAEPQIAERAGDGVRSFEQGTATTPVEQIDPAQVTTDPAAEGEATQGDDGVAVGEGADNRDYDAMKVDDLKALAEQRGVEVKSDMKKADIVDALRKSDG